MKSQRHVFLVAAVLMFVGWGTRNALAQADDGRGGAEPRQLHIQHTMTTSQTGFPQSLFMYHVLDGVASNGQVLALKGTISLQNHGPEFSEVLWVLAYWKGECP